MFFSHCSHTHTHTHTHTQNKQKMLQYSFSLTLFPFFFTFFYFICMHPPPPYLPMTSVINNSSAPFSFRLEICPHLVPRPAHPDHFVRLTGLHRLRHHPVGVGAAGRYDHLISWGRLPLKPIRTCSIGRKSLNNL